MRISKIISGGQTGVDRGALDAAIKANITRAENDKIAIGGYCTKGGRCEDNADIIKQYGLTELFSSDYRDRTIQNILKSDATLIITPTEVSSNGGTALTIRTVIREKKPYFIMTEPGQLQDLNKWLDTLGENIILNVAGPRQSKWDGAYELARSIVKNILEGGE